jgi:hypothetical protein
MDQLVRHVALVSEVSQITASQLARAGAAIQKQVTRDFGPLWNIQATVDAFPKLEDVPVGYWPVLVQDDIQTPGAAGIHEDKNGQPFALVQYSNSWTLTVSHEILEMLADPFGNRLVSADSIKTGQGRVEYLVEVCDPSEDATYSYRSNGVMVSDFYTPNFFDPKAAASTRYSYTGFIKKPRQVLKGGYLSWHDPATGQWWQQTFFGAKPSFRNLGALQATRSLREEIDRRTPVPSLELKGLPANSKLLAAAAEVAEGIDAAASAKAEAWRHQIAAIKRETANEG